MADYAKSVLEFDGTVLLEEQSATTWENITNVIPLLEDVDHIKIASQPAHALKARAYLRRQRPDLAERLVRADDYRPGEWVVVKPLLRLLRTLGTPRSQGRRTEDLARSQGRRTEDPAVDGVPAANRAGPEPVLDERPPGRQRLPAAVGPAALPHFRCRSRK
jgi:hypothetical protein